MRNAGRSEKQCVQRELLKEATAYASKINRNPVLRAKYEKKIRGKESVYHFAIKEFFEKRIRHSLVALDTKRILFSFFQFCLDTRWSKKSRPALIAPRTWPASGTSTPRWFLPAVRLTELL